MRMTGQLGLPSKCQKIYAAAIRSILATITIHYLVVRRREIFFVACMAAASQLHVHAQMWFAKQLHGMFWQSKIDLGLSDIRRKALFGFLAPWWTPDG